MGRMSRMRVGMRVRMRITMRFIICYEADCRLYIVYKQEYEDAVWADDGGKWKRLWEIIDGAVFLICVVCWSQTEWDWDWFAGVICSRNLNMPPIWSPLLRVLLSWVMTLYEVCELNTSEMIFWTQLSRRACRSIFWRTENKSNSAYYYTTFTSIYINLLSLIGMDVPLRLCVEGANLRM